MFPFIKVLQHFKQADRRSFYFSAMPLLPYFFKKTVNSGFLLHRASRPFTTLRPDSGGASSSRVLFWTRRIKNWQRFLLERRRKRLLALASLQPVRHPLSVAKTVNNIPGRVGRHFFHQYYNLALQLNENFSLRPQDRQFLKLLYNPVVILRRAAAAVRMRNKAIRRQRALRRLRRSLRRVKKLSTLKKKVLYLKKSLPLLKRLRNVAFPPKVGAAKARGPKTSVAKRRPNPKNYVSYSEWLRHRELLFTVPGLRYRSRLRKLAATVSSLIFHSQTFRKRFSLRPAVWRRLRRAVRSLFFWKKRAKGLLVSELPWFRKKPLLALRNRARWLFPRTGMYASLATRFRPRLRFKGRRRYRRRFLFKKYSLSPHRMSPVIPAVGPKNKQHRRRRKFKRKRRSHYLRLNPLFSKRSRLMVTIYVRRTVNNIFYSLFSNRGRMLATYSNGRTPYPGSRRMGVVAHEAAAKTLAGYLVLNKIKAVRFFFTTRLNHIYRTVMKIFKARQLQMASPIFRLRKPHSMHLRKRASRRV